MSPLPMKSMPRGPAASSAGVAGGRSPGPPTAMKRQPSNRGSAFSFSTSWPQRSAGQLLPGWWAMGARAMIGPGPLPPAICGSSTACRSATACASRKISGSSGAGAPIIFETISTLRWPVSQPRL